MKLKVATATPVLNQETGGSGSKKITKTSSSSKLKALVKNGKNKALKMKQESTKALIKVLPKSAVSNSAGENKRDYDTDSSSQDQVPLLPDYEASSTDEDSHNGGRDGENFGQFSPSFPDQHELPIATPVLESSPKQQQPRRRRQVQPARKEPKIRTQPTIKVNVNSHRSKAFYAAAKNHIAAAEENSIAEEPSNKFSNITCHMPQFPSDVSSAVSGDAVLPPKDPMADAKLISKAAFLKALQVSGVMLEKGNTLCVKTYEQSLREGAVPCITKAPASIEGAKLEIVSTTTQTTSGSSSVSSIILLAQEEQEEEQLDCPDDESQMIIEKSLQKAPETNKGNRRRRHRNRSTKEKSRGREEVADPDAVADEETTLVNKVDHDDDDDFFLMTVEDVQEITQMAREFANENAPGEEEGGHSFGCYLVKDVVEWLLCTSIQGGGRHTMTKKQAKTWFADEDMVEEGQSSLGGLRLRMNDTKFADEDMMAPSTPPNNKRSVMKHKLMNKHKLKSASQEFDQGDNSVVEENDDSDSDDDSFDDGEDFYFEDQSATSANKVVRQFRPTGMICTDDLAVVYGGDLEQSLEGTIETVLVADGKKYDENKNDKQMELEVADCEFGDELELDVASCPADEMEDVVCADDPIPNFDESKFNYDYQNYRLGAVANTAAGPMDLDAIVCESEEDDEKCWDTLSNITPHSAHSAASQHTALHRRLQQLETELTRLQVEYQEITDSSEKEEMEEFQNEPTDDSSIDGPSQTNDAPQSGGDNKSVRSDKLQAKMAAMQILRGEKEILERRVQELVSMLEASELCHSKQMEETKKASDAKMEELRYQQQSALDEAALKIQELESSLLSSQTKMADIRAKYSHDLEAAKILQSNRLQDIQNQQKTALDAATSKIEELESSLLNSQTKLEELKEKYSRDLEAAEREQMYKARERDLRENDLRSSLDEVEYKAEKDREESERMVREIREEHTKKIEEMIQQLDVVVAQHEKEHAKEFEKLIAQLDLVVAEHEEKTKEMDKLVQEKDDLIANLGSQLAAAQIRLNKIDGSS